MNIEKYYDEMAYEYDTIVSTNKWQLQNWIPSISDLSCTFILDAACGTGYLADIISPIDNNIVLHGFDISESMLAQAKKKNAYQELERQDLTSINIKRKDFYDFAFCFGAFEFLSHKNLVKSVHDILHQVKPKGKFIFNTQLEPHPSVNDVKVHDLGKVLSDIQDVCKINRIDPIVAYVLPPHKIKYLLWTVTKL